jgi:hypothetical protein
MIVWPNPRTRYVTIYKIKSDYTVHKLMPADPNFVAHCVPFQLKPMLPTWSRPTFYVAEPTRTKEADFYRVHIAALAFKKHVYEGSLLDVLERGGEVLPALRDDTEDEFCIFNPMACYNCLDRKNSKFRTTPDEKVVVQIFNYSFYRERLGACSIFKIPESHGIEVFASSGLVDPSEEFFHQYHANGYVGLKFEKVWEEK